MIMQEEQYKARAMFHSAAPPPPTPSSSDSSGGGGSGESFVLPAILPVLSRTPGQTRWAGPGLGQHTSEVLEGELGLSAAEIAALRSAGAI
jgi:crotonobetainyl-CoA:carnitine CoA-transferase CaiB-like acyl-CoA transferase